MSSLLSPEFAAFAAIGGYTVTDDADAVEVWSTGGEVRYRLRTSAQGFIVDAADRAEDYRPEFRSRRRDDAERYLTVTIGEGPVRSARGLGVVGFAPDTAIAAGFRLGSLDGQKAVVVLSEGEPDRSVDFLRGMEWEAIAFSFVMSVSLEDLRRALLDPDGAPVYNAVARPARTAPTILPSEQWDRLSPEQRQLADRGLDLFRSLDAKIGRSADAPVSALPFDGGIAVMQAVRGGGTIFVAADGSVMYRSSSFTFDRALADFSTGSRTPIESFG